MQLDEPSSFATTFGITWGRYRWLRLPLRVSPAPEEFQGKIDAYQGMQTGDTEETMMRKHSKIMTETCEKCSGVVDRRASSLTRRRYSLDRRRLAT